MGWVSGVSNSDQKSVSLSFLITSSTTEHIKYSPATQRSHNTQTQLLHRNTIINTQTLIPAHFPKAPPPAPITVSHAPNSQRHTPKHPNHQKNIPKLPLPPPPCIHPPAAHNRPLHTNPRSPSATNTDPSPFRPGTRPRPRPPR